jgi:hypothetical protein
MTVPSKLVVLATAVLLFSWREPFLGVRCNPLLGCSMMGAFWHHFFAATEGCWHSRMSITKNLHSKAAARHVK